MMDERKHKYDYQGEGEAAVATADGRPPKDVNAGSDEDYVDDFNLGSDASSFTEDSTADTKSASVSKPVKPTTGLYPEPSTSYKPNPINKAIHKSSPSHKPAKPIIERTPSVPATKPESARRLAIKSALEARVPATIVFTTPDTMYLDETQTLTLLLSPTKTIPQLENNLQRQLLSSHDEYTKDLKIVGATIKVSDDMEARLSGLGFIIEARDHEKQFVKTDEDTEWKWEIKPKEEGVHQLHLTLNAIIQIEGEDEPYLVRSFDKEITVQVTWGGKVARLYTENKDLFSLLLGSTSIYGLYEIWQKRRKKPTVSRKKIKQANAQTDPEDKEPV